MLVIFSRTATVYLTERTIPADIGVSTFIHISHR